MRQSWPTPEDSPVCPHCLAGEPALLPLRSQAAGEAGDPLLGDILPLGSGVMILLVGWRLFKSVGV